MSRSNQWFTAPAPPAERYPPRQVAATRPTDGSPATYMVVIVVSSSSDWTFGLVSWTWSASPCRTPPSGRAAAVVAREASTPLRLGQRPARLVPLRSARRLLD